MVSMVMMLFMMFIVLFLVVLMVDWHLDVVRLVRLNDMWDVFFKRDWDGIVDWNVNRVLYIFVDRIGNFFVDRVGNVVWNFHWHFDVLCLVNRNWVIDVNGVRYFDFLVHGNWDLLFVVDRVWFVNVVWDGTIDIDVNWIMLNLLYRIGSIDVNNLFDWEVDSFFYRIRLRYCREK